MEQDFETRVVDLDDADDAAADCSSPNRAAPAAGGDRRKVYAVSAAYGGGAAPCGASTEAGVRFDAPEETKQPGGAGAGGGTASFRGAAELVIAANRVKRIA